MADQRIEVLARRRAEMMSVISAAALEQFSQHGLRGTSTQAIADRAGISKQQLHYYIESKDALYESLLRQTMQHWRQIGLNAEDGELEPAQAIARLVRRKLEFTFDHPQISRLFSYEVMSGGVVIRKILAEVNGGVTAATQIIRGWVTHGKIEAIEPIFLLFHIWALTQHYADYEPQVRFFMALPADMPLDRERISAEVTRFVIRGMGLRLPEHATGLISAGPTSHPTS